MKQGYALYVSLYSYRRVSKFYFFVYIIILYWILVNHSQIFCIVAFLAWGKSNTRRISMIVSFAHNLFCICLVVLKFCTEHGSDTAVLCTTFQNDWATETDVMVERDFANFEFTMSFGSNILYHTAPLDNSKTWTVYTIPQRTVVTTGYHSNPMSLCWYIFIAGSWHRCRNISRAQCLPETPRSLSNRFGASTVTTQWRLSSTDAQTAAVFSMVNISRTVRTLQVPR